MTNGVVGITGPESVGKHGWPFGAGTSCAAAANENNIEKMRENRERERGRDGDFSNY